MSDREKAITHLMIIHTWAEFARKRDLQFFTEKHLEDIAQWSDDAIELLKEQKAVEPKHYEATRYNGELYACSDCFHELETVKPRFCSFCGKPILWEDGMRK